MPRIKEYLAARLHALAERLSPESIVGRVELYTSSPPIGLNGCGCGASARGGTSHFTGCAAYRRGDTVGP